jgi:hypothetical protein
MIKDQFYKIFKGHQKNEIANVMAHKSPLRPKKSTKKESGEPLSYSIW